MLATFRLPILDARGFVADAEVAESVVLPGAWTEGDFVRGMGRVTKRSGGIVEPWAYESAFADLGRTLTIPPGALQEFERLAGDISVARVRKRGWRALERSDAMFDVDVALQLVPDGTGGVAYPQAGVFDVEHLAGVVADGASLPVHVRSGERDETHPMLHLGKVLAAHYAVRTSNRRAGDGLVRAGRMTAVVEAPGLAAELPESLRAERLKGTRIQLASLKVPVPAGGTMHVHVLWDGGGTKGDRKRIRELRIHVLRLHSIFELMHYLASRPARDVSSFSDTKGEPGFDRLQQTLLDCVRVVRAVAPGQASSSAVLDTAFFRRNFVDPDLKVTLSRTLGRMRPKVRDEVQRFIDEEHRRAEGDRVADIKRDQQSTGQITIVTAQVNVKGDNVSGNQYKIDGGVHGPVGDNAKNDGNIIGTANVDGQVIAGTGNTVTIGGESFAGEELAEQLRRLRERIAASSDAEAPAAADGLACAEKCAKQGDSGGVASALKNVGAWALGVATQIGVPIAQAALRAAVGL